MDGPKEITKVLINTNYNSAGTKVCVDDLSIKFRNAGFEMPERTYFEMDEPSDWIIIEDLLKRKNKQKNLKEKNDKITKF